MKISIAIKRICATGLAVFCATPVVSATRFDLTLERQPLGAIAPLVLSNTDLSSGNVKAYRPWFENGAWQGDIAEYSVTNTGSISTSVDFTGISPTNTGANPTNWSALVTMTAAEAAAEALGQNYWEVGRKIITAVNGAQKAFTWNAGTIGAGNMWLIDPTAVTANESSSHILNYIRGDRSNEYPAVLALHPRVSTLGDIIHSNPTYVAAPDGTQTDNGYAAWATGLISRAARIYVGANDGMLHVFDAADGSEVYAYIPSMLIPKLNRLAARPFEHNYFVDGKLTAGDAYFSKGGVEQWRTVLVGTLGAGGKGFFALDITDPNLTSQSSTGSSDLKVLWEIDASSDNDIGDTFGQATIMQLNDGKWYAAVGNGYNSTNGKAILYLIDIATGTAKKITTNSGDSTSPNGLSTPTMLDTNKDGKIDYAYAGDIDGNLWKFDLTSDSSSSWAVATGPLHPAQTVGEKPITMAPRIALHPTSGYILYFATGRLFTQQDIDDNTVQSMYGIWDAGTTPPNKANQSLLAVTLDAPRTYTAGNNISENIGVYNPDAGNVDWSTQHGWKIDFPAGYRVLEALQLRGARAKVTAHHPAEQKNILVEASIYNGGAHPEPIFDLNGDGTLNNSDRYDGNSDADLLDAEDVPMAWQRADGIMSQVTIARVSNGIDTLFLNFLQPYISEVCEGSGCGGFQNGHIDVDTWHNDAEFGGYSTKHTHEYDKVTDRVFIDFFDLNVLPNGAPAPRAAVRGQVEINKPGEGIGHSGIAADEEFIVLVANADFSAGSTFKIGDKTWNVAEYQRQLHIALKEWDATVPDSVPMYDGQSFSFNWGDIADSNGGTGSISHNFNNVAILSGGLHPTQTICARDTAYVTYNPDTLVGRWRNGALTTQLVKTSHFISASAIDDVVVQQPTDLVQQVRLSDGTVVNMYEDFNENGSLEISNDEFIGGLIARTAAEHIWESAVWWHFGRLFALVNGGGKPCYGDANWDAAVALERSANPFATALEALGIDDLAQELRDNEHCKDVRERDSEDGCKSYYNTLTGLDQLRFDYEVVDGDGGGDDNDVDGDGVADLRPIYGGATNEGPTTGVLFNYGRASWTDVTPK